MLGRGEISVGGDLDLRGLTSLPAGAKLSAGGYLYLSGLKIGAGVYKSATEARAAIALAEGR